MLDPRETFEKYERRSPHPPPVSERREFVSTDYGREPVSRQSDSRLSCELRNPQYPPHQRERENGRLACEYRRDQYPGQLACELRARPTTTITTYLPENNKKKWPLGWIVGVSICIPIFIVIVLFAAVWLQEVGML
uniref:Uncharacterized protein n=1 Tax=Caenorhabditis japonica TaxID=281687 RepID=A0A8R1DTF8_CAEJA